MYIYIYIMDLKSKPLWIPPNKHLLNRWSSSRGVNSSRRTVVLSPVGRIRKSISVDEGVEPWPDKGPPGKWVKNHGPTPNSSRPMGSQVMICVESKPQADIWTHVDSGYSCDFRV